jgi:hypothetical protein
MPYEGQCPNLILVHHMALYERNTNKSWEGKGTMELTNEKNEEGIYEK